MQRLERVRRWGRTQGFSVGFSVGLCVVMSLLVLHAQGCAGTADRDLDVMQSALWQASAAVRDDRPDSLLQAMESFNNASMRAASAMPSSEGQPANERWTSLRTQLLALLDSPNGRKIVQRLTREGKASRFIALHTALTSAEQEPSQRTASRTPQAARSN